MTIIDQRVQTIFSDKIFLKNLIFKFKEKLNCPNYITEKIISKYQDGEVNSKEVDRISKLANKKIVNPGESLKIQAKIRENRSIDIITRVNARARGGKKQYWAEIPVLAVKKAQIPNEIVEAYPDLLESGLWAEIRVIFLEDEATDESEFAITDFQPLQQTVIDFKEFQNMVAKLTPIQWRTLLLRSLGIEPLIMPERKQLLFLSRLIPFVEKNYNFIELGARGTGKSYIYRQISCDSVLVSGGKTTVANLFYNMGTREMGLVGRWNVVAFDEVAYVDFEDKTAIQILKDYMEMGSFSRGKEEVNTNASMVFLGNINHDLLVLLHSSHLFEPLPDILQDMALIDRFHFYLPGWEMSKLKEVDFTTHYGLQADYLSLVFQHLRNLDYTTIPDQYYVFDPGMDARDLRAVKKTVSGFLKLLHPTGNFTKEDVRGYLELALEGRKRIKEQLTKLGSFEYELSTFEYVDRETRQQYLPTLPEEKLSVEIRRKLAEPGVVYIGQILNNQEFALLRLKIEARGGNGKLYFIGQPEQKVVNLLRRTFIFIRDRFHLREKIYGKNFFVELSPILSRIDADISNAFFIAIYSLLSSKSVSAGLLVTEKSSIYRQVNFRDIVQSFKAEGEAGQIKTLLPVKQDVFVEVPKEVIAHVPYFIKV